MLLETPFTDIEYSGKLILDTRTANVIAPITNGTQIGVAYTWNNINWQQVLHMASLVPGSAGYQVEHEAVGIAGLRLQLSGHAQITDAQLVGATTCLVGSTLCNTGYCPNTYGIQSVINEYGAIASSVVIRGFGYFWVLDRRATKSVFYMKDPESHTNVTIRMFTPTVTAATFGTNSATDLITDSIHTFTFTLIKE